MSSLKAAFEDLFHWSNITYISNAYPADVWISFNKSKLQIDQAKLQAAIEKSGPSGNLEIELRRVSNLSWMKLSYASSHKKERDAKVEYVTVVAAETIDVAHAAKHEMSAKIIVLEYEVKQNLSFIITKDGEFQQQKYGSSNLWEDWRGKNHKP